MCKRKTLLTVTCKCEKIVCFGCRHPDQHKCSFDYKEEGRKQLTLNNPVIKTQKLDKV
jgi:hypothetical protein